eukprot:TRINITY_DN67097_c0_g1_i1.p1 TRINITY_DN67097_c0_g1~~TRINITY_DN67097_c0_g1_i1.p1  ORF type:complete len:309 (+),score=43.69 TRINITY_DN67097_c0_g1_i1:50-976(+)
MQLVSSRRITYLVLSAAACRLGWHVSSSKAREDPAFAALTPGRVAEASAGVWTRGAAAPEGLEDLGEPPSWFDKLLKGDEQLSKLASARAADIVDDALAAELFGSPSYGGLVRVREAVGRPLVEEMRLDAQKSRGAGLLRASVGGHGGRSDLHNFITREESSNQGWRALAYGIALLSAVGVQLSRRRPDEPLAATPAQLACYPGQGESFWAHEDGLPLSALPAEMPEESRRQLSSRRVSAILYLQNAWDSAYGGAFRAHPHSPSDQGMVDLAPEGGALLLFRSRDLVHEVLPSYHPRFALAMWYLADS